ncbi:efflux RND transporter permease subunit [Yoonia sp. SDW83-1]|uniref:efflux RND transporter permease subunit n=1 Tax=Yoonia sp. SDW83-1 TaxID=3366945 RepID=UPI00398C6894
MRGLIRAAASNPVFSNLLMIGLILAGLSSLFSITVKNFPKIDLGAIQVSVAYPGATPQEVADTIIVPIEGKVRAIDGIRRVSAEAVTGNASVTLSLERGAEPRVVLDDVKAALGEITVFPSGSESPIVVEAEAPELAIQLVVTGQLPVTDIKDLAFEIREELLAFPNITSVDMSGAPEDQIDILLSQRTLDAYGTGLRDLAARITNESLNLSGGTLLSDRERLQLRTEGKAQTGTEFGALPIVSSADGAVLTLSDIAKVQDGLADSGIVSTLNGDPAVFLSINREGDQQILELVEATQDYLNTRLKPRLPETVDVIEWRNEAELLNGRIDLLSANAIVGFVLILVLLAVTLEVRVAFWVVIGIATAFIASFSLMAVFGVTINQLSLFGFILALGVVVDDAIVVGENTFSRRQSGDAPLKAAQEGVLRVAGPVFFAVATTMCAFVPLLLLPGTSGSFIAPVASVVLLVLFFSLIDSLFILPHHLASISDRPVRRWSPFRLLGLLRKLIGGSLDYVGRTLVRRAAQFAVRQPLFVILTSFGLFFASLSLLSGGQVKFVFFPDIEGDYVVGTLEMPEGVSEVETTVRAQAVAAAARRVATRIADDQALASDDVLQATVIAIGYALAAGDPGGVGTGSTDTATIEAKIMPAEQRSFSAAVFERLWREETADIPGIVQLTFSSSVVPIGADIALQVGSKSDDARVFAVNQIKDALAARQGILSLRDSEATTSQEAVFIPTENAKSLGVTVNDVAREIRSAVFGELVTTLQRNEEEIDVRVRLPESERTDLNDLADYRVRIESQLVPISSLGSFTLSNAPSTISRVDARRITTILADVDETITTGGAEIRMLQEQVLPEIQERYPDVTMELSGEAEEQDDFGPSLAVNFGLALFAIFALLTLALRSYINPILILLTIPFGFMGALIGHAVLGLDLTLLSIFGVVGLSGIVINSALLLITTADRNVEDGQDWSSAVVGAVVSRFRPIFLTTLTTFLGVTPLVLETSIQAQFLIPTAISLGAGILIGSLFVLFLVPAYLAAARYIAAVLLMPVLGRRRAIS